MLMVNLVKDYW